MEAPRPGLMAAGWPMPGLVVQILRKRYPPEEDARADPFLTLIATVLSQRTRDESTAIASERLFASFPDARALAAARPSEVEPLIRASGFYRQKARTIIKISKLIFERGSVPRELEELLELPGVGRKTANCVLVYGFGVPAIPVDTHVHRISNRLGWVKTGTPERTEEALRTFLPKRYWLDVNELFVLYGREVCRPIGPRCGECAIRKCPSRGRLRQGNKRGRAYIPGYGSTLLGGLGKALRKGSR